jgi:hypothetical protein
MIPYRWRRRALHIVQTLLRLHEVPCPSELIYAAAVPTTIQCVIDDRPVPPIILAAGDTVTITVGARAAGISVPAPLTLTLILAAIDAEAATLSA